MTIAHSTHKPCHRLLMEQGYSVTAQPTYRDMAPGCALAVQFGDRVRREQDGRPQFAIRVRVEVGSYETGDDGSATHWAIRKSAFRSVACEWTQLNLEIELFVAATVPAEMLRLLASLFQKHFRPLLEDADAMLKRLPVYDAYPDTPGPPLRLECRLIGDLFAGRSGLLSLSERKTMSRDHREANRVACGWLMQSILPELSGIFSIDTAATESRGKEIAARADLVKGAKVRALRAYARARAP